MRKIKEGATKQDIVEAIQECLYDLNRDGQLIDSAAIDEALSKVKQMDWDSLVMFAEKLINEEDGNEVSSDTGRQVLPGNSPDSHHHIPGCDYEDLASIVGSVVERLLRGS